MHQYQVFQTSADRSEIVLSDHQGRRHLARPLRDVPEVGKPLRGPRPALGFGVLMDAGNQRAFKLIFEQVDCDRSVDPSAP